MKDIPTQIDGATSLPAADFNQIPDELENLITKAGLTLDGLDLDQVGKAISIYSAGGSFYTDSGVVDAYVLSPVGTKLAPEAYFDGMKVAFFLTTPNTGASTVNVNGIGVKNIVDPSGAPLTAGDLDDYVELVYILGSDEFRLIETAGGAAKAVTATAWVNFDGTGVVSIRDQHNVSSITDNGVGLYVINFTTSLTNSNGVVVGSIVDTNAGTLTQLEPGVLTVNNVPVQTLFTNTTAITLFDPTYTNVLVFGGQ